MNSPWKEGRPIHFREHSMLSNPKTPREFARSRLEVTICQVFGALCPVSLSMYDLGTIMHLFALSMICGRHIKALGAFKIYST